ncbi:E3 ubiquitin ligase complex SCF subunit [Madurella fahalii]|uniref:E3 ubiquitin ligase complex SCF subunit n=1 Tax=Madurella fahalii TaxID=1157608 RepID=A0ABQ0GK61_9PEZI
MSPSTIRIQNTTGGKSGKVFEIDIKAAKHSAVINMLLQDFADQEIDVLPISVEASDQGLAQVFDWLSYHKDEALVPDDVDDHQLDPMAVRNETPTAEVLQEHKKKFEDEKKDRDKKNAPILRNEPVIIVGWDKTFFNSLNSSLLYEVLIVANYLEIKRLLDMGCQAVANMISGKSAAEIREFLGIENDFTPEQEAQIRKETAWVFDLRGVDGDGPEGAGPSEEPSRGAPSSF